MKQAELKKAMLAVLSRGCLKRLADDLDLSADRRSAQVMRQVIADHIRNREPIWTNPS
jgi:hypothetical protein